MLRRVLCLSVAIVILVSVSGPPAPAAGAPGMTVWTVGTGTKIQPTTAQGSGQSITLEGARKAYEAYQVVVTAGPSLVAGVNLTATSLGDGVGDVIPAGNLTFFREGFVDFTGITVLNPGNLPVSGKAGDDNRVPDPLIPFVDPYTGQPAGAPFTVTASTNQPVWLDVYLPVTAVPGVYTGTVTVTATGQTPLNVPLTLTVWNLTLPDMSAVTTYFGMGLDSIIKYHAGTYDCTPDHSNCWRSYSPQAQTIAKRYQELAHDHRIDVGEDVSVDTSSCTPPTDWSTYDAALQPYMDGSYWSDGVPSTWLDAPFQPGTTWGLQTCSQTQYQALAAAWSAHLKAKGWFGRSIAYSYDEPDPSVYPAIALNSQWMQAADSAWKPHIMDTTAPQAQYATMTRWLGIYTVALAEYDHWDEGPYYGRAEWPALFAQGIRLWLYESNNQGAPWPTYATNTLLGNEPRIMKWGAWYEGATGFLMWQTLEWDPANPWGPNALWQKTGDGMLIYPGNHNGQNASLAPPANGSPADVAIDGPVPSYRLKMIRAGLQDWALFTLAAGYGLTAYAHAQVAQAYTQLGGCTWSGCTIPPFYWKADDQTLSTVRDNIAQAIISAKAKFVNFVYLPAVSR